MYWFSYVVSFLFFRIFYPCKVVNKKNITDGGMIFIANHVSNMDGIYIAEYLPYRKHYFMGKKEMFKNKLIGKYLKSLGGIPVDRSKADLSAIKNSLTVLKKGKKLIVFPEGTRNKKSEELQEIKSGAAMLAIKAKVPVLPIHIAKRAKVFCRQRLYIGEPFDLSEFYDQKLSAEVLDAASKKIEEKLLEVERQDKLLQENKKQKRANSK